MAIPRVPANPQFQFGALPDLCYGTIRTSPGVYSRRDAKNVCEAILNRNLADVAAVLSYRSFGQRRSILCWYEERLGDGRLLISDLIKTFGEDLREVVQAMLSPPEENNVRWVRNALGSTPINHMALVEILGVRSNAEISRIKEVYYQLFGVSLFEDIANQVTDECKVSHYPSGLIKVG